MHRQSLAARSSRLRRLLPVLAAAAALAGAFAAPAAADVRVTPNRPLLPDNQPVYGRDAVGLAVNPRDERHIVAVYTDLDTFHCEVATSRDGGRGGAARA
jgi:hypothetical protein